MPSSSARARHLLLAGVALVAAASCGNSGSGATAPSAPTVPSTAVAIATDSPNPYGEAPSHPPTGLTSEVLSVIPDTAPPLELAVADVAALGASQLTINEPFVLARQTFTGAPLSTVLAKAGIPATATVETVGVDDYTFTAPAARFLESGALVAYEVDGSAIPPDQGGPLRLVYSDGSELGSDPDAWTWRLVSIQQVG